MRVTSYMKGDLPFRTFDDIAPSFEELPADPYTESNYRFRRWSEFYFDDRGFLHKHDPVDSFEQSSDVNVVFGDVERKFEPIDDKLLDSAGFQMMFDKFRENTGISSGIGCHQVRIVVQPNGAPATPEGPHKDGFDYIGAFIVKRDNITGGDFCVWHPDQQVDSTNVEDWGDPIFSDNLWTPTSRHFGILRDRDYFHTGHDLETVDPDNIGQWDWFILTGDN